MPKPVSVPKLCIFDLDGTLVDSLRDIAEALNECLELLGLAAQPVDRYRHMVGEGVPKLCQRAIGEAYPFMVERLIELARARYRVRPLRHTRPFAEISDVLASLRSAGIQLAVLSNKPHDLTKRVVQAFWPDKVFGVVQGYVREDWRKPEPHHVLEICGSLATAVRDTWVIGDTPTDVETARRAGAVSIAATWGFRAREELEAAGAECIVDHPREILEIVNSLGSPASGQTRR